VRLEFSVPVLTPFMLNGSVLAAPGDNVGSRTAAAAALVQFGGCVGCSWDGALEPGGFQASGWLLPGRTHTLSGSAGARLKASSAYPFGPMLGAVPEPAGALLLALGAPWLAWLARRLRG
jgi:hypothetical protein